jgi:SAM-dependent methyltransferase
MNDVLAIYEAHAGRLMETYDGLDAEAVLAPIRDWLPTPPASVLDVGAGSGRDAAWFGAKGHAVTAAEPVAAFREAIAHRAPAATVVDARLPDLAGLDGPFDLVLASGVLHHLCPVERDAAYRRCAGLLLPGGRLVASLRMGRTPPAHGELVHVMDPDGETARAEAAGLKRMDRVEAADARPDLTWTWLVWERTR